MPSGRAPKHLKLITGHRTKREIAMREEGEAALKSSEPFEMWSRTKSKAKSKAHFEKIRKAFENIGEGDVMYEAVLNRYCIIIAECDDLESRIVALKKTIQRLEATWEKMSTQEEPETKDFLAYVKSLAALNKELNGMDAALGAKRNALLQIEKENIMTVLAKLRAVPKEPKKSEEVNPLEAYNKEWGQGSA